ncbi:MAG TPA: DNA alkylation repair protein [Polyangiaceae bacterium]|nr:DNA alkylation repair protein [Polyangiaceae bacterium]
MSASIAEDIAARLRAQKTLNAPILHRLRREFSKEVEHLGGTDVIAIAHAILDMPNVRGSRMIACALVGQHPRALADLRVSDLERLGRGLATWGDVDVFACLVAGRAWRDGSIPDRTIQRWARSTDRWWRRAAAVSTVPLNVRAQGGSADAKRTLAVCKLLVDDRDDIVVKALSWALRELAVRDPRAVAKFLTQHRTVLAARVLREVENKLKTGLKSSPRRRKSSSRRRDLS